MRSANTSDVFPSKPKHANVVVVSSDEDEDSQDGTVNYNQTAGTVVNFNETTSESHHPFLSTFTQAAQRFSQDRLEKDREIENARVKERELANRPIPKTLTRFA